MSGQQKVVAALESWNKAWMTNEEYPASSRLLSFYQYSPEWMAVWDECWLQYDQCADAQRSTGAPRLTWQDEVENYRIEEENSKKRYSRPLDDKPKLWQYLPLSVYLNKHLKRSSQDRHISWSTALDN